jgi:hypothetical protein
VKDAKGHGSNKRGSHATGVSQVGQPVQFSPAVLAKMQALLARKGGFSVRPSDGASPKSGYMVSLPGHSHVSDSGITPETLRQFGMQHSDALSAKGAHIGGWTDAATGKTYLDVSHKFSDRGRAIEAGKARNQIAIYDVKRGKDIRTGGTGK